MHALVPYDGPARTFLLRAKVGGRREVLRCLAMRMAAALRAEGLHRGCTVLAPIPSNPWTDLRRGFSPSGELARLLARETGIRLRSRLLIRLPARKQATKRMLRRDRAVFAWRVYRAAGQVRGERVLLVDDVMTTGSTAEVCARLLRRAGAREVRFLAWARTLPGRIQSGRSKFA